MSVAVAATATGLVGPKGGRLYSATVYPSSLTSAWVLKVTDGASGAVLINTGNQVGGTNISPVNIGMLIFPGGMEFRVQLDVATLTNITEVIFEVG